MSFALVDWTEKQASFAKCVADLFVSHITVLFVCAGKNIVSRKAATIMYSVGDILFCSFGILLRQLCQLQLWITVPY